MSKNVKNGSQIFMSAEDKDEALAYHRALNGGHQVSDEVLEACAQGLVDIRETLVGWGLDPAELLDVTDVTDEQINALTSNQ